MENIILESPLIKEKICNALNKKENEHISIEEMKNVKKITLNKKNLDGTLNEYTINDFYNLNNIENLILNDFIIDDDMINKINCLSNLTTITLNFCKWDTGKSIDSKIKKLIITGSEMNYEILTNYGFLENIILDYVGEVDMKYLSNIKNIEEMHIHNSKVKNSIFLKTFNNLKLLNLDGSQLDNEKVLEELKNNIKISFNKIFFYI